MNGTEPEKKRGRARATTDEDVPMPRQEPDERVKNFSEVALGYTEEMALKEAARCLQVQEPPMPERLPRGRAYPGVHRLHP